jgi:hypothetical protein
LVLLVILMQQNANITNKWKSKILWRCHVTRPTYIYNIRNDTLFLKKKKRFRSWLCFCHQVKNMEIQKLFRWVHRGRGQGVAQAVSRRISITAILVRSQVKSCGLCGRKIGTWPSFLRILPLPMPIPILLITPHMLIILWFWRYAVFILAALLNNQPIKSWTWCHLGL